MFPFQFSTTFLVLVLPLTAAQPSIPTPTTTRPSLAFPTPTQTLILTHLLPPYGPGPANFYASVIRYAPGDGTYFAVTCFPATASGSATLLPDRDPCNTSTFGKGSQIFLQGNGTWKALRTGSVEESGTTRWLRDSTICGWDGAATTTAANASRRADIEDSMCTATTSRSSSDGLVEETGAARAQFGLTVRPITVTGGFSDLTERTQMVTSYQFTDIGKPETKAPPRTTVTLYVMPGAALGSTLEVEWMGLVVSVMSCLWMVLW